MFITLKSVYDSKIAGKYDAKTVKGINLSKNEEWEKSFFANQDDLVRAVEQFSPGDRVNVVMEKKGQHYNIVDFLEMSPDDEAKLESYKSFDNNRGGGGAKASTGSGKAATKSTWNGRTGDAYDRSAAVYLAMDLLKVRNTEAALRKMSDNEFLAALTELAEPLFKYIHDGAVTARKSLKKTKDVLDAPELD